MGATVVSQKKHNHPAPSPLTSTTSSLVSPLVWAPLGNTSISKVLKVKGFGRLVGSLGPTCSELICKMAFLGPWVSLGDIGGAEDGLGFSVCLLISLSCWGQGTAFTSACQQDPPTRVLIHQEHT